MIIAIDGPVASGKSTIGQEIAHRLGFYYLYTGMLYRGIAYALVKAYGYDEQKLKNPDKKHVDDLLAAGRLEYRYSEGRAQLLFDGTDITDRLKTAEVDNWASTSSALPVVRQAILHIQQEIGRTHDIVADGRDMGTVVFPDAEYKFFLTASVEVRARRWQADQKRMGNDLSLQECIAKISERDHRDTTREHSPLIQAPDAIVIDSSELDLPRTIDKILSFIAPR